MPRQAKPWFRAGENAWYAQVRGKQRRLIAGKANKAEAQRILMRLLLDEEPTSVSKSLSVGHLFDLFLDRVSRDLKPKTFGWYRMHLERFASHVGVGTPAQDILPLHVDSWIKSHAADWNDSTRRGAITAVKTAFSWGHKRGYLKENPIRQVERPSMGVRKAVTPDVLKAVIEAANPEFRRLIEALYGSGCRPEEVYTLTADQIDIDAQTWTVVGKSGKRVVHLPPALVDLSRKLVQGDKGGPVFRNTKGRPWTKDSVRNTFKRLKDSLGIEGRVYAHGLRHLFATDALDHGVPIATVAQLMGHSDTKMISQVYSHLDERHKHLSDAVGRFRKAEGAGKPPSDSGPGPVPPGKTQGAGPDPRDET